MKKTKRQRITKIEKHYAFFLWAMKTRLVFDWINELHEIIVLLFCTKRMSCVCAIQTDKNQLNNERNKWKEAKKKHELCIVILFNVTIIQSLNNKRCTTTSGSELFFLHFSIIIVTFVCPLGHSVCMFWMGKTGKDSYISLIYSNQGIK